MKLDFSNSLDTPDSMYTRVTWELRPVACRSTISDYELRRASSQHIVEALVRHAVYTNAAQCARFVESTYLVGERKEQRTDQVPFELEVNDTFVVERPGRLRAALRWLLAPLLRYLELTLERRPTTVRGNIPHTYTHTTMVDPFITERLGWPTGPRLDEARMEGRITWRVTAK